jgi:EAL domain-containing protein (putative c-di-GMP-specific phosphodiesterase class I)
LWYQPKIDLTSQLVCGAEALVRLRHPERGVLAPAAFLPPPADPLHKPLADFVIRRALSDWSALAAVGIMIRLAVNMPISIFETQEFVSSLRRYLPQHAKFPGFLIELTEDEVIRDPDFAREITTQLKLYNVNIAIDDFGKGYSTLERLQELPFAELKIDRKHVDGCSADKQKYLLCQGVVTLAHRLNIIVVAEGVETAADARSLSEIKCDAAQGYYYAKPMEREEFIKLLLSRAVGKRPAPAMAAAAARA